MEPWLIPNIHTLSGGKPLGIWGCGVMGIGWIRLLDRAGIPTIVYDHKPISPTVTEHLLHATCIPADRIEQFFSSVDTILVSAGIDTRPFAHLLRDVELLSELDLLHHVCAVRTIAITGSVGKTTVTQGLAHLLTQRGLKVSVGGNVGISLADIVPHAHEYDYLICEVSSFQLERVRYWAPHGAIWTNFWPNHLDRHDTVSGYWQAKARITHRQTADDWLLVSPQVQSCIAQQGLSTQARVITADVYPSEQALCTYPENYALWQQALALLTPEQPFDPVHDLVDFTPDAHRMQTVLHQDHIRVINDSKATIPAAAQAALNQLRAHRVVWILGGISKGVDRLTWIKHDIPDDVISCVVQVYTFGAEADELARACHHRGMSVQAYDTLEEVCQAAWDIVKKQSRKVSPPITAHPALPGEALCEAWEPVEGYPTVLLFCPSGASYDLFANYQERGQAFTRCITALANA